MAKTKGHTYELKNMDNGSQTLQFIHKEENEETKKFETVTDGTTNEAVLEMMIDRMEYLQGVIPCRENKHAIDGLKSALNWLRSRTAGRVQRKVEGTNKA